MAEQPTPNAGSNADANPAAPLLQPLAAGSPTNQIHLHTCFARPHFAPTSPCSRAAPEAGCISTTSQGNLGSRSCSSSRGIPLPEEQARLTWHRPPDAAEEQAGHQHCPGTFRRVPSAGRSAGVTHPLTFQSFRTNPRWWRRAGSFAWLQGVRDISGSQIFPCRNLEKVTSSLPQLPLLALLLTWM